MPEILMVCYGNLCRSPMAEALLRAAIDRRLGSRHEWVLSSAGTGAADGYPAPGHGVDAMARRGLDIAGHRSRAVTPRIVESADLIVCMARSHADFITSMAPEIAHKVTTLGDDVPDPIGGTAGDYEQVARILEPRIEALADSLVDAAKPGGVSR